MSGMRCTVVDDCDAVATVVISGGAVVLLTCERHGRRMVAAADDLGRLTIRTLRPRPVPRRQPA